MGREGSHTSTSSMQELLCIMRVQHTDFAKLDGMTTSAPKLLALLSMLFRAFTTNELLPSDAKAWSWAQTELMHRTLAILAIGCVRKHWAGTRAGPCGISREPYRAACAYTQDTFEPDVAKRILATLQANFPTLEDRCSECERVSSGGVA